MLNIKTLLLVVEIKIIEVVRAGRSVVSSTNFIEVYISPICLIEYWKLAVNGCKLQFSSLYSSWVDNFVIVLSIIREVSDVSFELVDARMDRNSILFKITKKVNNVLIAFVWRNSMSQNLRFIIVNFSNLNTNEVYYHWLIEFRSLSPCPLY